MTTDYVEAALKFFEETVEGWMLGDFENMETKIPPIKGASGNCNFPIALSIFSCIEFLGYLTSENLITTKYGGYSQKRIMSYIDSFFDARYLSQIQPYRRDFVNIFRHGLAHEYFAKAAGISRTEPTLIKRELSIGAISLDADQFYLVFKDSTQKLKSDLVQNKDGVAERLVTRYSDLLAKNIKKIAPTFVTTTTHTITSGPSIARPLDSKQTTTLPLNLDKYDTTEKNCRCETLQHNHPSNRCDKKATEADGLCKECHNKATEEFQKIGMPTNQPPKSK